MDQVGSLMENLRADQIPILPHYVEMHHVDMSNSIPDDTNFLDSINADISAVLNVPRVASRSRTDRPLQQLTMLICGRSCQLKGYKASWQKKSVNYSPTT